MPAPKKYRVMLPDERVTPFFNHIFDEQIGELEGKHSALVYFVVYDRAWHRRNHRLPATVAQIARWCGLDERTVENCLDELLEKQFIERVRKGVPHSHIHKPVWSVPAADWSLGEGGWLPIPRFLVRVYLPRFHNAVALLFLLRYQHIHWLNHSWVGMETLSGQLGWSASRTRSAVRTMGKPELWLKQGTGLPRPLKIIPYKTPKGEDRRRFSVRAVRYEKKSRRGTSLFLVPKEFRRHFKLPSNVSLLQLA
jgi:hypothetical protein